MVPLTHREIDVTKELFSKIVNPSTRSDQSKPDEDSEILKSGLRQLGFEMIEDAP